MNPDELKAEIANAERAVEEAIHELGYRKGGLNVLRQMLVRLEAPPATTEDTPA